MVVGPSLRSRKQSGFSAGPQCCHEGHEQKNGGDAHDTADASRLEPVPQVRAEADKHGKMKNQERGVETARERDAQPGDRRKDDWRMAEDH
jgi:hypothetical protein